MCSHGMSPLLEKTNARCAAFHCYIATKISSSKPGKDEPASCLTGSDTNLLCFKTLQVPVTHPVFCK